MIIGPDLATFQALALDAVDQWAEECARRSPARATMDAIKVREAEKVRDGGSSALIAAEASLHQRSEAEQAAIILALSETAIALEVERLTLKKAIRQAGSHADVGAVLRARGIAIGGRSAGAGV